MTIFFLLACSGSADSSTASADPGCGDLDGEGGDSGDIPDVLGNWTSTFGSAFWDDNCATENLDRDTESWIGSFYITGSVPGNLYVYFGTQGSEVTERFWGAMDPYGGVSITGEYPHSAGTLHSQFGGLVFYDAALDRDAIQGSATLALDADPADGIVDCVARGSWTAYKSG